MLQNGRQPSGSGVERYCLPQLKGVEIEFLSDTSAMNISRAALFLKPSRYEESVAVYSHECVIKT
jgi:hypothetical protein